MQQKSVFFRTSLAQYIKIKTAAAMMNLSQQDFIRLAVEEYFKKIKDGLQHGGDRNDPGSV